MYAKYGSKIWSTSHLLLKLSSDQTKKTLLGLIKTLCLIFPGKFKEKHFLSFFYNTKRRKQNRKSNHALCLFNDSFNLKNSFLYSLPWIKVQNTILKWLEYCLYFLANQRLRHLLKCNSDRFQNFFTVLRSKTKFL